MKIDESDIEKISEFLEEKNSLFKLFWNIGTPSFVGEKSSVRTAAIIFDTDGNELEFVFNKEFYETLDYYTKCFVTCHEMLHILLNHGKRMIIHKDNDRSNIAMDLVVNHLLVNKFGFDREKLCIGWESYCWVDTIFIDENSRPLNNKSYEYYYSILESLDTPSGIKLIDSHGEMSKDSTEKAESLIYSSISGNDIDGYMKNIMDSYSIESSDKNAGIGRGEWFKKNIPKKILRRWELAIQKSKFKVLETISPEETWIRDNRRMSMMDRGNMFLPSSYKIPTNSLSKEISDIWFFLDYSGSCVNLFDSFISAVEALNKKKFKVRLLTFDTHVQEIDIDTRKGQISVYGGGGTNFKCIEEYIEDHKEEIPDAYFIITDGFSSSMFNAPEPEKFHWFLTNLSSDKCIPRKSTIHRLSDYC